VAMLYVFGLAYTNKFRKINLEKTNKQNKQIYKLNIIIKKKKKKSQTNINS
jgi:hypothetical protein